jgi:uncharacterized protein (TIGR00266 family)
VRYEVRYKPAFATLFVQLQPAEQLVAEAGAMASMAGAIQMTTQFSGGLFPALLKRFFGGESLFVNIFHNPTSMPLEVVLTQASIGDMVALELNSNEEICFQPGAYIAHMGQAVMTVQWAGFKSWFSGEGLFKLKLRGPGLVFFGGYGGISETVVNGAFVVDTGHLVAYTPGIQMNIRLAGGVLGSLTSGEGFVNRLTGQGRIYLQSRSTEGLVRFLRSKLR